MSTEKRMKRYADLENSDCVGCGGWLCVMSANAKYTGIILCPKCLTHNLFDNSCKPWRMPRGQEPDREICTK